MSQPRNQRIHVGNLAAETTAAAVTAAFTAGGHPVARVQLVMSREPGRSRGFGFVDLADDATASTAVAAVEALQGTTIDGRAVRVSLAHPPRSRFGGTLGGPSA